jgi:hypothetical protein
MPSAIAPPAEAVATGRQRGRAVVLRAAGAVGAVAVVAGLIVGLLLVWWAGLAATVVVGGAIWGIAVSPRFRGAEARVLALVGPSRPADPRLEARLLNLVDGLVPSAGIARPRCVVVDDPAPNALAFGADARRGYLVTTTGLTGGLSRMELEGVVADLLVQLRDGATIAPTLALSLRPGRPAAPGTAAASDAAAVALTRYPPGLAAALGVLGAAGPAVPRSASPVLDGLWLAPPGDAAGLSARVEALDEL